MLELIWEPSFTLNKQFGDQVSSKMVLAVGNGKSKNQLLILSAYSKRFTNMNEIYEANSSILVK